MKVHRRANATTLHTIHCHDVLLTRGPNTAPGTPLEEANQPGRNENGVARLLCHQTSDGVLNHRASRARANGVATRHLGEVRVVVPVQVLWCCESQLR